LGRAALYRAVVDAADAERASALTTARRELTAAVDGLRAAHTMHVLSRGLLSRAWLRFVDEDPDGARADLDAALEIAERGAMRLPIADILLTRARLFRDKATLVKARQLIAQCGYHRRNDELADAEEAARLWPDTASDVPPSVEGARPLR
jgi:hypothetical protein